MSEYIVKLPTYGAADEFFKTHEMPDMTLYGYPLTGEIVRCRDCKYHEPMVVSYLDKPLSVCISEQWIGAEGDNPLVKPDGFCAWGERRTND